MNLLLLNVALSAASAASLNGFDLRDALIPSQEIFHGGPGKDGIPAIDEPRFERVNDANWLNDDDRVMGISLSGTHKAYPLRILNWHEIVNDQIGGRPVVVSYCPLCGSGLIMSARADGLDLKFGVSGLLYKSDMLLYDRKTESLWSQMMKQAVSGDLQGTKLSLLTSQNTTWKDWRTAHPDTVVLSRETGYARNYSRNPYAGYEDQRDLYFPVSGIDPRYHPKQATLGIELNGKHKAYPYVELDRSGGRVEDSFAGQDLIVRYDRTHQSAWVETPQGERLPTIESFWFAWMAFHPDSEVFEAN
ncbi:MAG: DUF3179 domain-containing protein [Candidatus Thiodiazotropha sp. (ex Notomyrtea botanica)]|nr:DUF3179 domain-containing protein [Candidatus Thiodiazotropha sp. (ex Notomyrtea botanica)]